MGPDNKLQPEPKDPRLEPGFGNFTGNLSCKPIESERERERERDGRARRREAAGRMLGLQVSQLSLSLPFLLVCLLVFLGNFADSSFNGFNDLSVFSLFFDVAFLSFVL